mgnify:CR=1
MTNLHNQHVIRFLKSIRDYRLSLLSCDSPHGDYIYYSYQDYIDIEIADQKNFINF